MLTGGEILRTMPTAFEDMGTTVVDALLSTVLRAGCLDLLAAALTRFGSRWQTKEDHERTPRNLPTRVLQPLTCEIAEVDGEAAVLLPVSVPAARWRSELSQSHSLRNGLSVVLISTGKIRALGAAISRWKRKAVTSRCAAAVPGWRWKR